MFTKDEVLSLSEAVDLKIASLRRGFNTAKQQSFKVVFNEEIIRYTALLSKLRQEFGNVEVSKEGQQGKK